MDNKPYKTIALKKEGVSNLNVNQMDVIVGGILSVDTIHHNNCDSVYRCCTMFDDCKTATGCNTMCCASYTCFTYADCPTQMTCYTDLCTTSLKPHC